MKRENRRNRAAKARRIQRLAASVFSHFQMPKRKLRVAVVGNTVFLMRRA